MKFRLTYAGKLQGASRDNKRPRHKHEVRRAFYPQLRALWRSNPLLKELKDPVLEGPVAVNLGNRVSREEALARDFSQSGYRFVPLVTTALSLTCRIKILFLRPDPTGALIRSGDIDNRLKTLLDALRKPKDLDECGGYDTPLPGEDSFFCLLEDDSLITEVNVETDMLLEALPNGGEANDARLVITVSLRPSTVTWGNIGFGN